MSANVYQIARDFSTLTNRCIFLTGKAGTGKTTFLHQLRDETSKQMVIAAPTGIAAIHAGGTTLHSLFQLPLGPFIPTDAGRRELIANNKMRADRRRILYELELLVIDEVSMLRADTLDAIDTLLRHFRYKKHLPFGGVQLIVIGDLFQLSPVMKDDEWRIISPYYTGYYFFQSHAWASINPVYIELDTIFRQQNQDFVDILNQVRNNCLTAHNLAKLNARYEPTFVSTNQDFHITLTTHNRKADSINASELAKIKEKPFTFNAVVQGEFQERNYPTDSELQLKAGARVMFVKNDEEQPRRFFNGQIGVIEQIDAEAIIVKSNDQLIEVTPMAWRNLRYSVNEKTKVINEEMIGSFVQYPLRLAWAITIHKSQGLTFDKVVIDAENAFAAGQVYVALSRCRTLEGIKLLSRINTTSLHNAREVIAHEQTKASVPELENIFRTSERNYQIQLYSSIFEFRSPVEQAERLREFAKKNAASFNNETFSYTDDLIAKFKELGTVADKFANQLAHILGTDSEVDKAFLAQRFAAACDYFNEKILFLAAYLKESPMRTDVKATAKETDEMLKEIHGLLMLKLALMQGMKQEPNVLNYFLAKKNFRYEPLKATTHAGATAQVVTSSNHPTLMRQLAAMRNKLAKEAGQPLYVIGSTAMLIDISNHLPQTKKELLAIKGMGKAKFERFGQHVLELIEKYVAETKAQ